MSVPHLNRRKFLSALSATGSLPMFSGCGLKKEFSLHKEYTGHKWWLEGIHAPVQQEVESTDLVVQGSLPDDLSGLYVRNGGNFHGGSAPHFFVGDGMLHGVWMESGKAKLYRNRWVQTSVFGNDKKPSLDKADNMSNTSIIYYGGRLLSLMEIGFPYEINPDLSTKGVYRFDGTLRSAVTAHPKIHPTTGDLHFFGMSFFSNPYLNYRVANEKGDITKRVDIKLPGSSMQHDFQVTENYAIFLDLPVVFSKKMAVLGAFPYEWKGGDYSARIGILPHKGTSKDVRWFEIETCFCFHTLNAFEEPDGTIVLQLTRLPRIWVMSPYDINEPSELYEYRIHPTKGILSEGSLHDKRVEFGTVSQRYAGRAHQYAYYVIFQSTSSENTAPPTLRGLIKYDQRGNPMGEYNYPAHEEAAEFVFQPSTRTTDEDDGYLMGFVYNKIEKLSTLDVFHTQDIKSGPIARVQLNHKVPSGYHGVFVPQS